LTRRSATVEEVVSLLNDFNVGVLQMPCPELTYAGVSRPKRGRDEYDTKSYRRHCCGIADSVVAQLKALLEDTRIIVIIGVEGSPSCSVTEFVGSQGILIEELITKLEEIQGDIPMIEVCSLPTPSQLKKLAGFLQR
jgi:predicted secreted protein